jgi:hypothetical protein
MASGGSSLRMLGSRAVVTGPVRSVEFSVVIAVVLQVPVVEFIVINYLYITNI